MAPKVAQKEASDDQTLTLLKAPSWRRRLRAAVRFIRYFLLFYSKGIKQCIKHGFIQDPRLFFTALGPSECPELDLGLILSQ